MKKIAMTTALIVSLSFYGCKKLDNQDIEFPPYIQLLTESSATIKYITKEPEKGCLSVDIEGNTEIICEPLATKMHNIPIKGLASETTYTYNLKTNSQTIEKVERYITTLAKEETKEQTIWVVGDSGKNNSSSRLSVLKTNEYLGADKIDTFLMLGDNAYESGKYEEYEKSMFVTFKELLKTNAPWMVIGNHDSRSGYYYDIFDFPTKGQSGGVASGSESYYSFDNGGVHYIMLDSQHIGANAVDMIGWLRKDLATTNKKWIVAAFHHPPYTNAGHNSDDDSESLGLMKIMRELIVPELENGDVDIVLTGHSHSYERSHLIKEHYGKSNTFSPSNIVQESQDGEYTKCIERTTKGGTIYNVAGSTASSSVDPLLRADSHPALPFSFDMAGSVIIKVQGNVLSSDFISIDGDILDSYKITKTNCVI